MNHFSIAKAKTETSGDFDGGREADQLIILSQGNETTDLGAVKAPTKAYNYNDLLAYLASTPMTQGNAVVEMRELERY